MHSNADRRLFALIPAAGESRRMGRPKLLLPFGETTVLGQLLATLRSADISECLVLVRPGDEALRDEVRHAGAIAVQPESPPPEMRVSVEHLLREVRDRYHPRPGDGWLLIPADHPLLQSATLGKLVARWRAHPESIVLPTCAGRRGHPTLLPWSLAEDVFGLPADVGVNHLLRTHSGALLEVPLDDPTVTLDLDTPADYARALKLFAQ